MENIKNTKWVETAQLQAVTINSKYGIRETEISLILMSIILTFVSLIISSYLVLNYGDIVIKTIRDFVMKGNFFTITLYMLSVLSLTLYVCFVCITSMGIRKTKVGINHQVNTKANFKTNIISLIITSSIIFIFIILIILRMLLYRIM